MQILSCLVALGLASLAGCTKPSEFRPQSPAKGNSSAHAHMDVAKEAVQIEVEAERSGHSLVVKVRGLGNGHASGTVLEDPKAWLVAGTYDSDPLRQVLAGPAKVSREPTGAAFGAQWNVSVEFMVAFALPDRAGRVALRVQAPTGEETEIKLGIEAPLEKLSMRASP